MIVEFHKDAGINKKLVTPLAFTYMYNDEFWRRKILEFEFNWDTWSFKSITVSLDVIKWSNAKRGHFRAHVPFFLECKQVVHEGYYSGQFLTDLRIRIPKTGNIQDNNKDLQNILNSNIDGHPISLTKPYPHIDIVDDNKGYCTCIELQLPIDFKVETNLTKPDEYLVVLKSPISPIIQFT